jgi:hypothetical protein
MSKAHGLNHLQVWSDFSDLFEYIIMPILISDPTSVLFL